MAKTINILGTEYKLKLNIDPEDDPALKNLFGYCSASDRLIVVVDMDKLSDWDDDSKEAKLRQHRETLRHEIIHAFFNESGLRTSSLQYSGAWSQNEEMVDWMAIQYPKMKKIYKELDCEE